MTKSELDAHLSEAFGVAAGTVGRGLAHLIRVYVPRELAGEFALALAQELLRELHRPEGSPSAASRFVN